MFYLCGRSLSSPEPLLVLAFLVSAPYSRKLFFEPMRVFPFRSVRILGSCFLIPFGWIAGSVCFPEERKRSGFAVECGVTGAGDLCFRFLISLPSFLGLIFRFLNSTKKCNRRFVVFRLCLLNPKMGVVAFCVDLGMCWVVSSSAIECTRVVVMN